MLLFMQGMLLLCWKYAVTDIKTTMAEFNIINIKLSCHLSQRLDFKLIEDKFPFLSDHVGVGRIVFRHDKFTFCLMGKENKFLNITGLKCFNDVMNSIRCFESFFDPSKILLQTIKFDSICAIYSSSSKIINAILCPQDKQFWIKRYPNILSRVNIRPRQPIGLSRGMTANVFKSGKCLIFGARNLEDVHAFIALIKNSMKRFK